MYDPLCLLGNQIQYYITLTHNDDIINIISCFSFPFSNSLFWLHLCFSFATSFLLYDFVSSFPTSFLLYDFVPLSLSRLRSSLFYLMSTLVVTCALYCRLSIDSNRFLVQMPSGSFRPFYNFKFFHSFSIGIRDHFQR